MRRHVVIFHHFGQATGHEHPHMQAAWQNYRLLLAEMELAEAEIEHRINTAMGTKGPLKPIVPEVERLLGLAKPVSDVLAILDEQYRQEARPEVYFLKPDQPISPHLDTLLAPTRDGLSGRGLSAYFADHKAIAVILYDAAAQLNNDQPDAATWSRTNRMNRAAALRDLGALEQARDELKQVAADMHQATDTTATVLGRCHYHLAWCQFLLGTPDAAKASCTESLRVYAQATDDASVPPSLFEQSRQLLADLEAGQEPPPRKNVDIEAELEQARARLAAARKLAALPLDQRSGSLLDQMLGPARSTAEVFEALDAQYREQNKPRIWFLPLDEPISPHLDELLGPIEKEKKKGTERSAK